MAAIRGDRTSRGLLAIGVVELVTLAVLFINLADGNNRDIAALFGPVHGTAYLTGVIVGWRSSLPRWGKAVTVVPGVGTLIAARWQQRPRLRPGRATGEFTDAITTAANLPEEGVSSETKP